MSAEERAALQAELARLRAWEHRYSCFDDRDITARIREIQNELKR